MEPVRRVSWSYINYTQPRVHLTFCAQRVLYLIAAWLGLRMLAEGGEVKRNDKRKSERGGGGGENDIGDNGGYKQRQTKIQRDRKRETRGERE